MKRIYLLSVLALLLSFSSQLSAQDFRVEARFLTDKMAYELNLSSMQYVDVYEINCDFVYAYQSLLLDMNRGNSRAIRDYNRLLSLRNRNVQYVLDTYQWRQYKRVDYFHRPLYRRGNNWSLGIYLSYSNRNHYYYNPPRNYHNYSVNHRSRNNTRYYYRDRHSHSRRNNSFVRRENEYRRDASRDRDSRREYNNRSSSTRNNRQADRNRVEKRPTRRQSERNSSSRESTRRVESRSSRSNSQYNSRSSRRTESSNRSESRQTNRRNQLQSI